MQQVQRKVTQKGKTPKVRISCGFVLGHMIKSHMTVIWKQMGRYREDIMSCVLSASVYLRWRFFVVATRKVHCACTNVFDDRSS